MPLRWLRTEGKRYQGAQPQKNGPGSFVADAFATSSGPSHFAIMAEEDITSVERKRWFQDFKVQLIPVSKADSYAEATEFLEVLHASI